MSYDFFDKTSDANPIPPYLSSHVFIFYNKISSFFLESAYISVLILLIFSVLMPKGIGIGDGILAIIYGIVYGWMRTCVWLIAGFLMAAVFGVFCYLFQRAKSMLIPLVPFLMLAHVGMCL